MSCVGKHPHNHSLFSLSATFSEPLACLRPGLGPLQIAFGIEAQLWLTMTVFFYLVVASINDNDLGGSTAKTAKSGYRTLKLTILSH